MILAGVVAQQKAGENFVAALTNPGAEAGDTSGWTDDTGEMAVRQATPDPNTGSYYFFGGANAETIAAQRVDLTSVTSMTLSQLNNKEVQVRARWWQASFDESDQAQLGLRFIDDVGSEIVTRYSDLESTSPAQTWEMRSLFEYAPNGAEKVDVLLRFVRQAGTNCDGYIDDVSVDVAVSDALPVSITAASDVVYEGSADTLTLDIPATARYGGLLIAAVYDRTGLTTPAGWTLVDSQAEADWAGTQTLSILTKTIQDGDAGSTQNFVQGSAGRIGGIILASYATGGVSVDDFELIASNPTDTDPSDHVSPSLTPSGAGRVAIAVSSCVYAQTSGQTDYSSVDGWALQTPLSIDEHRIGVATSAAENGVSLSHTFSHGTTPHVGVEGLVLLSPSS